MSDNVEALLGGEEDVGEYDLRDEEEDALLEDDSYEQSRIVNSMQEDGRKEAVEESGDVLELSIEELLNEDEENDLNDSNVDDNPRDKFTRERAEAPSSSSSIAPDTTTQISRKPAFRGRGTGRGGFPWRNARGSYRGGARGRGGGQRGYHQNVQNRNAKSRAEGWVKKPVHIQVWTNEPPNYQHPPVMQTHQPWAAGVYQQMQSPVQTMQQSQINKPTLHQRLGYNQHQQQQQPIEPFVQPPPVMQSQSMQMQPQYEQESIITSHPIQMSSQSYISPQQYSQPPPLFNQPPPQYTNQNVYQSAPNYQTHSSYVPQEQQPEQFMPQYNPDPYMSQPQEQQIVFQNNTAGFYITPVDTYNNGNDDYQQHYNQDYYRGQQQQPRIIRTNKYVNHTSPQKKRRDFKPFVENNDAVQIKQRRVFENKNLHEVKTVENAAPPVPTPKLQVDLAPIPDNEDEETKEYRLKIEKQKRLREVLLARKEERRRLAAQQKQVEEAMLTVPSPKELLTKASGVIAGAVALTKPNLKPPPTATNPNLRVINSTADALSVSDTQLKSFLSNRKIIAKDDSLLETSIVVVSNLAAGTSEVKLRKICSGVGDIQNFELSTKERQATIQFNSVASAHAFYKRYQRFMLDLSMIQVTLKPYS